MAVVGNLVFQVRADSSALQADMREASRRLSAVSSEAGKLNGTIRNLETSMSGAAGATQVVVVSAEKQKGALRSAAEAAHTAHVAHSVYTLTQHGVAAATGKTITTTSGLVSVMNAAKVGAAKAGTALRSAAARLGAVAAAAAPAAAAIAPFAIGGAVVVGLVAVNKALIRIAASSANLAPVADAFDNLARHIHSTGDALRSDLNRAVAGTVPELELMQSSVVALNSGAIKSRATLVELAEGARTLGRTVGMDTADAFDNLIRGIGLMNPQLLKSLGILVSVDEATRRYAQTHGVAASSLTDLQKKEAFRVAVLEEMRGAVSRVGDSTDDLQTSLQRSEAASVNFQRGIRNAIAEAEGLKEVAEDMSLIKEATKEFQLEVTGPLVTAITNAAAATLSWATGPLADLAQSLRDATVEADALNTSLEDSVIEGISTPGPIPTPALPTDFEGEMERIRRMKAVLGDMYDASEARQRALTAAIRDGIADGWDPAGEAVQNLVEQLRAEAEASGSGIEAAMERLDLLQEGFDLQVLTRREVGEMLTLRGRVNDMLEEGVDNLELRLRLERESKELNETLEASSRRLIGPWEEVAGVIGGEVLTALRELDAPLEAAGNKAGEFGDKWTGAFADVASEAGELGRVINTVLSGLLQGGLEAAGFALVGSLPGLLGSGVDEEQMRLDEERNRILVQNQQTLERMAGEGGVTAGDVTDAADFIAALTQPMTEMSEEMLRLFGEAGTSAGDVLQGIIDAATAGDIQAANELLGEFGLTMSEFKAVMAEMDIDLLDDAGNLIPEAVAQFEAASEEFRKQLAEMEAAFLQSLEVRRLEAQGLDEQAANLKRQIQFERELAEARAAGFAPEVIAELKEIQRLEEEARQARKEEAQRQAGRDFGFKLAGFQAELAGDDRAALELGLRQGIEQELAAAQRLVDSGAITQAMFDELAAVLEGLANQELANYNDQMARQAEELERANRSFEENLRLNDLLLAGKDHEAEILRKQIQFEEELRQARERGISEELIAERKAQQQRELDRLLNPPSIVGPTSSREAARTGSSSRTSLISGITESTGARITSLLATKVGILGRIERNTAAMVSRLGGRVPGPGIVETDQALALKTKRGSRLSGDMGVDR